MNLFSSSRRAFASLMPTAGATIAGLSLAGVAAAQDSATLIYTNIPGLPQSQVPGMPGVSFQPDTGTNIFDRVYGSPNGNWILTARAELATTEDEVVILNGEIVQREGQPAPWLNGTENSGAFDQTVDVNDAGDFTFITTTSGIPSANDYVVTNVNGVWGFSAMEEGPIPAIPGAVFDDALDTSRLLGDGTSFFIADRIDGPGLLNDNDEVLISGSTVLLQAGVSIPTGQDGGATETVENLDFGDSWITPDGQNWLSLCDLTGFTNGDDVVVVNGAVVLQEAVIIPGSGFTLPIDFSGIDNAYMDAGGNWFARGKLDITERDWVVRNGIVIAEGDAPVAPGSTELWSDENFTRGYFLHVGNTPGDYVIGGATDNADLGRDRVLILNGETELMREGDPLDIDGNGAFDDNAFVDDFGLDDGYLSDAGLLYLVITIKDSTDTRLGQGFIVLDTAGRIGTQYCAANANSAGLTGSIGASGSTEVANNNFTLIASNLPQFSFGFFVTSQTQGFVANPGGSAGNLCLGGALGRFLANGGIMSSGVGGTFALDVDLTQIPQPTGTVAVAPGDTWNFQGWHRDSVGSTSTSNFTVGLEVQFR